MLKAGSVFVVAVLAGYLAGRPGESASAREAGHTASPSGPRQKPPRWEAAEIGGWIRQPVADPAAWNPVTAPPDLSAWSADELRAALDATLGAGMTTLSQTECYHVVGLLLNEWTARDLDAVVAWFEALPSEEMKRRLDGSLGKAWPLERGEEALDFVVRNGLQTIVRGGIAYPNFLEKAFGAAARRGPEALARMVETAASHGMESRYSSDVDFPEGFDFAALAALPGMADVVVRESVFFAGEWARRDPAAAFEVLVEKTGRTDGGILESWLAAAVVGQQAGDASLLEERLRWLAGRVSGMESGTAAEIAANLAKSTRIAQESPVELGQFVGHLADPELRKQTSQQAAEAMIGRHVGIGRLMDFLEQAGPVEERMEVVRAVMVDNRRPGYGGLFPRDEPGFREKLAAWGLSAEATAALVDEIKNPKR
jgi:hypothetical protein